MKGLKEKGFTQVSIPNEFADVLDVIIRSGDFEYESRAKIVVEALKQFLSDRGYYAYEPRFEYLAMRDGTVFVNDRKEKAVVRVSIKNHGAYCEYDRSYRCAHVRFVKLIKDVKKPRKSEKAR